MGACPMCGGRSVRRRPDGTRKCRRHGFLLSGKFLDRAGNPGAARPTTPAMEQYFGPFLPRLRRDAPEPKPVIGKTMERTDAESRDHAR